MALELKKLNVSGQTTLKETVIGSTASDSTTNIVEKVNMIIETAGTGGGGGGGINRIYSSNGTVHVDTETGPDVDISVSTDYVKRNSPEIHRDSTAMEWGPWEATDGRTAYGAVWENMEWHKSGIDIVEILADYGGTGGFSWELNNSRLDEGLITVSAVGEEAWHWGKSCHCTLHMVNIDSVPYNKEVSDYLYKVKRQKEQDIQYMTQYRSHYMPEITYNDIIYVDKNQHANLRDMIKRFYYFPHKERIKGTGMCSDIIETTSFDKIYVSCHIQSLEPNIDFVSENYAFNHPGYYTIELRYKDDNERYRSPIAAGHVFHVFVKE